MNTEENDRAQQNGNNNEQNQAKSHRAWRVLKPLDLFYFQPFPTTKLVQSKGSIIASIIMLSLFLAYLIFTFIIIVVLSNAPRVNTYLNQLPIANYSMPPIAFAFFLGEPFNQTINDPTIFTFSYQMIYKPQQAKLQEQSVQIPLNSSCRPDWMIDQGFDLLCPSDAGNMSGVLYESAQFIYPRISVQYCNQSNASLNCISQNNLSKIAAGGRILLFIKNEGQNIDLITGTEQQTVKQRTFQFFLIPGLYPRAQIYFTGEEITRKPDYLTRFEPQVKTFLHFEDAMTWQTNVSVLNPDSAFQIIFAMESFYKFSSLYYVTILEMISLWGAAWSVLFSIFSFSFLKYNKESFYSENKEWEEFGSTLKVNKPKDTLDDFEEQDNQKQQEVQQQITARTNNSIGFEMGPL